MNLIILKLVLNMMVKNAPGFDVMKTIVQLGCRTAIKISEKI